VVTLDPPGYADGLAEARCACPSVITRTTRSTLDATVGTTKACAKLQQRPQEGRRSGVLVDCRGEVETALR
jgi:hypothetical protein